MTLDTSLCRWTKPQRGYIKANEDGSWLLDSQAGSLGYLIHNENGVCYIAVLHKFKHPRVEAFDD